MRFSIPKAVGLALFGLAPVLLGVHCAPTGLKVSRQESTYGPTTLGARMPPPPPPPRVGGAGAAGGAEEGGAVEGGAAGGGRSGTLGGGGAAGEGSAAGGSGVLVPGQGDGAGFQPKILPNARAVGYSIDVVDFNEPGTLTIPGDPKVGTLYRVTNPAYEDGEYALDEIGVDENARSVAICDAKNADDAEQNANALSMSEITMNVWTDTTGQSPTAIESIYVKNVVEDSTQPVITSGHSLFNSRSWSINSGTTDPDAKAIFEQLTTRETAYGGAVNKMNSNWIGKSVNSLEVEGYSITYHLV